MPAYSYLKSDIINTSENDSTEFANQIPNFIDKAERRLTYYLDDYGMDEYMNVSVSSGNAALVTLNDRTRIVRNINYVVSNGTTVTNLLPRTIEYAKDYWPVSASVGTPRYYSRTNNTNIKIVPTPTSTITAEIQTQSRPLALSSATGTSVTTSNYFSEYCYDALFQACMLEATIFMKDWNTVQFWKTTYDDRMIWQ